MTNFYFGSTIFEKFFNTITHTQNVHLLEENRDEDTAIPKFIEVIEEFASVSNSPGEQRFEGMSIIELPMKIPEEHQAILEEGDYGDWIEGPRQPEHPLVQLAIDLDAQTLSTVEDYPELDQEHRDTAFTKRSAAHGSIPSL